jgi:hypothetical protein
MADQAPGNYSSDFINKETMGGLKDYREYLNTIHKLLQTISNFGFNEDLVSMYLSIRELVNFMSAYIDESIITRVDAIAEGSDVEKRRKYMLIHTGVLPKSKMSGEELELYNKEFKEYFDEFQKLRRDINEIVRDIEITPRLKNTVELHEGAFLQKLAHDLVVEILNDEKINFKKVY